MKLSIPITCFIDKGIDMEIITAHGILVGIAMIFNGVMLPFVFKFGSENARTIMIILVAIPCLAVYLLSTTDFDIIRILEQHEKMIGIVVVIAAISIYIVSYMISVLIMEHKEIE